MLEILKLYCQITFNCHIQGHDKNVATCQWIKHIYTVSRKKVSPLKDFATTCVNLHQMKYIFTHIQPHVFQTMFQNFWKITYLDSEIKL